MRMELPDPKNLKANPEKYALADHKYCLVMLMTQKTQKRLFLKAQMLLGQFRLIAGDNAGALDALNAAIELDSTLGEAHYLRGRALQAAGEQAEAQEAFVRAADLGYWP